MLLLQTWEWIKKYPYKLKNPAYEQLNFAVFKMDAMRWYLNFVSCNFGTYDFYEAFS